MTGTAAPEAVTCTCAKTASCITALNSKDIPPFPLEKYTREDLEREYHTRKRCAPYCTISCVHQVAMIDLLRETPLGQAENGRVETHFENDFEFRLTQ